MLLSFNQLHALVEGGVLTNVDPRNINGSSIDIVLGNEILVEIPPAAICPACGHEKRKVPLNMYTSGDWAAPTVCGNPGCNTVHSFRAFTTPVDFSKKEPLNMKTIDITNGYALAPGESVLAHSVEVFHLPYHITAEYRLKSSMARVFLEHLHAGWCDPGWHDSVLTLELSNMSRYHHITLRAGEKCGQVMFYSHEEVPEDQSYAVRGSYNGDTSAAQSRGVK
jgi:dCTP deaminase